MALYNEASKQGRENKMKAYIVKVPGVRGFIGTTYAVWQDKHCVKIFPEKKDAENFAAVLNEKEGV